MLAEGLISVWVDVLADVDIALELVVTASRSSADVAVNVLTNALTDVMITNLPAVGVADVLADVDVSILAVVMPVLEFAMPTPLE